MNSELKVYCKNTQEYIPIDGGDTLLDLYHTIKPRLKVEALCALVNNKCEDLRYPVYGPKHVEFIGLENPHGFRAYVRSTRPSATCIRASVCASSIRFLAASTAS